MTTEQIKRRGVVIAEITDTQHGNVYLWWFGLNGKSSNGASGIGYFSSRDNAMFYIKSEIKKEKEKEKETMTAFKSIYVVLWVFTVSVARATTVAGRLADMNHDDILECANKSAESIKSEFKQLNAKKP